MQPGPANTSVFGSFLLWQPQPESLFLLYFYHAFPETFIRLPQLLYKLPLTLIETVTGTEPLCFAVVFFFAVVTSLHSNTLISKLLYPLLRDLEVCSVKFYPDEVTVEIFTRDSCGSATHCEV